MSIADRVRKGSFRGVEFDTITIGRKRVKKNTEHQYANSVRRYIEERGVQDADFDVTLSIFGTDAEYLEKRNSLRTALETEGAGVLIIPLEGEFTVKCTDVSDSQNLQDGLGRCDFSCTFKVIPEKEKTGNPISIGNSRIGLANNVRTLRTRTASVVNNNLILSNATNYSKSFSKYTNFANDMLRLASNVTSETKLNGVLGNFTNNLPIFLGNPTILGSAVNTVFDQLEAGYNNAKALFSSSETLFAFGDTDAKVSPNTPERVEAQKNQQVSNSQIQISALGLASNAFAQSEFDNDEELEKAEEKLIAQIDKIEASEFMRNPEIDGVTEISYSLKDVRNNISDVAEEKKNSTPKIVTIDSKEDSVTMLAYKYYDSLENVDGIIALNNIQNPKSISGKTRVYNNVG